jgi:hypothetical protein
VAARRTVWRWWAGVSALATIGYYVLPGDTGPQRLVFAVAGPVAALGIVAGVRLHRPRRSGAWYCFAGRRPSRGLTAGDTGPSGL